MSDSTSDPDRSNLTGGTEPQMPPRPVVRQSGEMRAGVRPGDRRLRIDRRLPAEPVHVPPIVARRRGLHPALVLLAGFASMIAIGTFLLTLPISSADGSWTRVLDALFTATSAVCVTGLVVLDTGTYWSGFGQTVILLLIQAGGLGFMTSATILLFLIGRTASLRERLLLREALGVSALGSVLPLAKGIVIFTFVAELVGTIIIVAHVWPSMEPGQAIWWGLFHAVSAFNNAGFDLVGDFRSLIPYSHDAILLSTVAVLVLLGGISYTVVADVLRHRRFNRLTLDSKLVLSTTAGLLTFGTVLLLFTERNNPATLGGVEVGERILTALFHSIASRTAGFATMDIGQMTEPGLLVTTVQMFIGGSAASTAGGIKVQTFSLLFFAILAAVRGADDISAFGRRVPLQIVLRAIAVALLAVAAAVGVSFLLTVTETALFVSLLFEAVSAIGTVGLSTGITPDTGPATRLILTVSMFVGRLGPLTLVLALAVREHRPRYRYAEQGVRIG